MRGGKFFSVPFDIDTSTDMQYIRHECGGIVALGRWIALLAMLFEQDGKIDLTNRAMKKVVAGRLELRGANQLERYLSVLCEVGWISKTSWESANLIVSTGVYEQLEFKKAQAERGRKGGLAKACSESLEIEDAEAYG